MSLLDKQEVQDICGYTALHARKWSGFINAKSRFFYFAQCIRKLALYSDVIHLFDCKSVIEHDGSV